MSDIESADDDDAEADGSDVAAVRANKGEKPAIAPSQIVDVEICDECGARDGEILRVCSNLCPHAFCRSCLDERLLPSTITTATTTTTTRSIRCPYEWCGGVVNARILLALWPLARVCAELSRQVSCRALASGRRLFICPTGCGRALLAGDAARYGAVHCAGCERVWCAESGNGGGAIVGHAPHWPLSCTEAAQYAKRRAHTTTNGGGSLMAASSEARAHRLDSTASRALARDSRRRHGHKLERQFSALRILVSFYLLFAVGVYVNSKRLLFSVSLHHRIWQCASFRAPHCRTANELVDAQVDARRPPQRALPPRASCARKNAGAVQQRKIRRAHANDARSRSQQSAKRVERWRSSKNCPYLNKKKREKYCRPAFRIEFRKRAYTLRILTCIFSVQFFETQKAPIFFYLFYLSPLQSAKKKTVV